MANSETYPVLMVDPAPTRYMGVIGSASGAIEVPGVSEFGTGTATAHVLGAPPYFGARVDLVHGGTATGGISVITDSTGVTLNAAGHRTVTLTPAAAGGRPGISLIGVSATRWHIMGSNGAITS